MAASPAFLRRKGPFVFDSIVMEPSGRPAAVTPPSGILQGSGFLPMHYPEEELGPVISLAVDRNNDLWIHTATGGDYHLTQGSWSRQNDALGKKPGILGA
jgi:hypothetical protein